MMNSPLKSVDKLKIGRAHSFISLPARSLFSLVSFGCLYKYITALPIPECFNDDCSIGGNCEKINKNQRESEAINFKYSYIMLQNRSIEHATNDIISNDQFHGCLML